MCAVIENDFGGGLVDAEIDDASHEHVPTKTAFETIFPFVRSGGVYIIEDWTWGHSHEWPPQARAEMPLMSLLLCELMLVCGRASDVISRVDINRRFAAIWRGTAELPRYGFRLAEHYIARGFSVAL
jgi:hypothetical protein